LRKITIICFVIFLSCAKQDKTLLINVDCKNHILINKKKLSFEQTKKAINLHNSKFGSNAKFKFEVCKQTSVKVLVELKNLIKKDE